MNKDKKSKANTKETKEAAEVMDIDLDIDLEIDEVMEDDEEIVIVDSDIKKEEKSSKMSEIKSKLADKEADKEETEAFSNEDEIDIVIPVEKKKYRLTKKYYLISLTIMILAAVVFVLFGPAASIENIGGKVYTATLSNHFAENRIDEIKAEICDIAGFDVDVKLDSSLITGMQVLEIRVKSGQRISQYLVRERLNEKFPYIKLGNFTVSEYSPMLTIDNLITYSFVLVLALIVLYIISGILLGGKNGFRIVFTTLHDMLLVISLYILLRVPYPRLLIVAALISLVASPYFNITKLAALEKNKDSAKKRTAADAVTDILAYEKSRNINLVISVGIMVAASVVVGIVMSAGMIMWFGGVFAVALGIAMYSTTAFVPNMWGIGEQPKVKKTKQKKSKKANAKSSKGKDDKKDTKTKGKDDAKKKAKGKK